MMAREIYDAAIAKFGTEAQTRKAVEELTELSLALQRALEGRGDLDNIREEIADVEIMVAQLRKVYDRLDSEISIDTWKLRKLDRLEKLISEK
jgi:NTP pyrophosphatase (non-canonical NTP hydrolase)